MRKLRRWLIHIVAGVSLAIFLCSSACWIVGRFGGLHGFQTYPAGFGPDAPYMTFNRSYIYIQSDLGRRLLTPAELQKPGRVDTLKWSYPGVRSYIVRTPIYQRIASTDGLPNYAATGVGFLTGSTYISYWLIILLSALAPAAWALVFIKPWLASRRRIVAGHCVQCGYDLRATTDRCPECGTLIMPSNPA